MPVASVGAPIVPKKSDRRLAREAVQMPYDADQPEESTKRAAEDVDAALEEPTRRQYQAPTTKAERERGMILEMQKKMAARESGSQQRG